ncbi:MAG: prepilin-type N-terminal cleavage/methylation domain-containing protein [Betaproteobacteria bacterium]|nr:MAG: prepilin-type N-terminal cleavage/methylation domain-containing protein [Betaproteobacteria bacterium]
MVNVPASASVVQSIRRFEGFTLIELLVTLSIIALLLSIAVPRYIGNVSRAEEAVLRENLYVIRDSIHKFYSDQGRYPVQLDDLVKYKYLRAVPSDPVTGSGETWVTIPPVNDSKGGIYDIRSGAKGIARDGSAFGEW